MIFGIAMLVVIYILWVLFVQGALWKIILFGAGWFGIYVAMRVYVEGATETVVTISGTDFSWASVVPTIICIMALATTKAEK
jgi:hypothetical protein